jgi:hypothetical protein
VLNAAGSQLGRLILGLARDEGLDAIAVIRRPDDRDALRDLGAAEVLVSGEEGFAEAARAALKALKPRVLLDAVGDQVAADLFFAMPSGAAWISYGKMGDEAPRLTQMGQFIFMDKRIEGFWLSTWLPRLVARKARGTGRSGPGPFRQREMDDAGGGQAAALRGDRGDRARLPAQRRQGHADPLTRVLRRVRLARLRFALAITEHRRPVKRCPIRCPIRSPRRAGPVAASKLDSSTIRTHPTPESGLIAPASAFSTPIRCISPPTGRCVRKAVFARIRPKRPKTSYASPTRVLRYACPTHCDTRIPNENKAKRPLPPVSRPHTPTRPVKLSSTTPARPPSRDRRERRPRLIPPRRRHRQCRTQRPETAMPAALTPPHPTACLVLADGTIFHGRGFGATGETVAELVFNTAMTGYQEIMTDPSYAGQIVTFTFPHVGNVGINPEDDETADPVAAGMVVKWDPTEPSNWRATGDLAGWLERRGRIGIGGIDTRRLTRAIRQQGAPHVALAHDPEGRIRP